MYKISKLLFAIVNQILPVPYQILEYSYEQYDQFIKSKQSKTTFDIKLNNYNLQSCYKNKTIIVNYHLGYVSRGFFRKNSETEFEIFVFCNKTTQDKDQIQHQLKHCVKFISKENGQDVHFYEMQFETYITDFCNLFTQIYKRLNRKFNVSLETIIQKTIIDVINNKTNINKYKNLFNNNTQFLCYQKTILLLQLYKNRKSTINIDLLNQLQNDYDLKQFVDKNKFNIFFETLNKHVIREVKKTNQYNIDSLIHQMNFYELDKLIQKRIPNKTQTAKIIELYIENKQFDYLANLVINSRLDKSNFEKSILFLRDNMQTILLSKIIQECPYLTNQLLKIIQGV